MHSQTVRAIRYLPILLLVVALVACGGKNKNQKADSVEPVDTGPTAQELFVKGNSSLDDQKWEAAIASYDEAIEKDAEQWEIHMNRGIALSRIAKFSDALSAFESALRSGGESKPEVYFNLGNLYQDRGMYSAAVDAYRASLAFEEGQNVDTLINLGAAYVFLRQWEFAAATYQHTQQLAPDDPRGLHGLALVKQLQDQYRDAAELYDRVHGIDPQFALAWFNQARCYSMMEEYDQAARAIQEFMRLEPDSRMKGRANGMLRRYKKKLEEKK